MGLAAGHALARACAAPCCTAPDAPRWPAAGKTRSPIGAARTDATVATSAAHSSFSIMRAQKSALNSASTTSIFSTSMASGKPLRVPGDINILCVMSFIVSGGVEVEGRGRATR